MIHKCHDILQQQCILSIFHVGKTTKVQQTEKFSYSHYPAHFSQNTYTHTHTTVLLLFWNMSGTTRVSRYQKGKTRKVKTNLDLLEQEIVSGSSICWAICKSASHPRQPHQHPITQFLTGQMPFLPPNQQRQSTEGREYMCTVFIN